MEILFLPFNWCMEYPWLALFPTVMFGLGYLILRQKSGRGVRRMLLITAILWLLYAVYEWRMFLWSKTVEVPIRVDLLLIAPVLYLATAAGLVAFVLGFRRAQTSSAPR